jgi:transcriptional regulator with XRE-family HTH domain
MATKPNHSTLYRRVPAFLKDLRLSVGLTQRELAAKMKKEQYFVARCETGSRRIDISEFIEWCLMCRVDPKRGLDDLMARR